MRRLAVALAAGALALAPAAAFGGPAINPGQPSSSGYLKGPDVRFTWQVTWAENSVIQVVEYRATPVGGGTPVSRLSVGNSGLGATILPLADGRYDVTAQARQTVNGPGGFESDPGPVVNVGRFTVDSVPPGPGTFELADGAEFTNRFSVAAEGVNGGSLVIGGSGSGAWHYELRQSQADFAGCSRTTPTAFPDGTGCGGLGTSPFRISRFFRKDVILPAGPDGVRTVWVRFRDAAYVPCDLGGFGCLHDGDGNASTPISDSIILDTTAPTIALTAGKNITGQAGAPVAFDAGASTDATSGVDPAGFRWDFKDGSPVVDDAGPVVEHTYPGPGSYPGEVRGRDMAGNPAVFAFTAFVGVAPPAGGGEEGPLGGPGGQEPPPVDQGGGGEAPPAGGAGGAAPAPPAPVVVTPKPKVLKVKVDDDKAFVNVNDEGVMRVRIETLKGRKVAAFRQAVDQGRNRLRVPRRLGPKIPDTGRLVLEMQVVADGVAGPVVSRRINAVALNPQPLPPKARPIRR